MAEPAYRTISDVATLVGVPQHVLRFWETRFPQIAPLKRGGNRRYYRPEDIAVITTIARLLHVDGYTIKGAQKFLAETPSASPRAPAPRARANGAQPAAVGNGQSGAMPSGALSAIRADLAAALAAARAM